MTHTKIKSTDYSEIDKKVNSNIKEAQSYIENQSDSFIESEIYKAL